MALGVPVAAPSALLSTVSSEWGCAKPTRCPHRCGGAQPTTPDLTCRESGAGTAHGGPALWEGVSWLLGSSRPWAGADETAGNGIWGDHSSASHERSRRDRARVFKESWGVLFKILVKHAGTERALQAFVRGQASTSTEASVCGGPQLTPDTGFTRAGLHQGWGPSRAAGGGPGLAHQRYWGNLPCRAGPGEVSTLLLHRGQGQAPGAGGGRSLLTRVEAGPCELVPATVH